RGREHGDLARTCGMGTIVTLLIGYKYRIAHARAFFDGGEYFGGIGQLRHPFRADETGRLDRAQARARQAIDQLDLGCRRDDCLFVLQAVARTHLDDAHASGHAAHDGLPARRALRCRSYSSRLNVLRRTLADGLSSKIFCLRTMSRILARSPRMNTCSSLWLSSTLPSSTPSMTLCAVRLESTCQ